MNPEYNLILVKGEDKTDQISRCEYSKGKWSIIYYNNVKEYNYSYTNVAWYKNPKVQKIEGSIVYQNNQPISGITKIIDFGEYYKIIFKTGFTKVYHHSTTVIEETCLSNRQAHSTFDYLKKISEYICIKEQEDNSFLSKQFSRITTISPRSVLSTYLERKPLSKENTCTKPIFPFGFNISQKLATERALTEHVSVIEGPPGTGKTQTILNIIANAIMNNKTVAVVSNNNSATANVLEKLQKYNVDFIVAYLGNKNNKINFFADQKNIYPDMSDWNLSHSDFQLIRSKLIDSQQDLDKMHDYNNKLATLKHQLSQLQTEYEYFSRYYIESNGRSLRLSSFLGLSADKVLSVMIEYQHKITKGNLTFGEKLYNFIAYGIYSIRFYDNPSEEIISFLQKEYYNKKIKELNKEIELLSEKLNNYDFDKSMKKFNEDSMILFKARLAERFSTNGNRIIFTDDAIWKNFDLFIREYPVILSTTHSLRSCASENYLFDYVIIDEASQVDIVTGALALSCAKSAVIVGDMKQLPNVVPSKVAKLTKDIFGMFKLDNSYSYSENSLLSSIIGLYQDVPNTLLKEHYRCHPKIIGFCNQKFYNNELIILTDQRENDKPLVLYKTAKGNHARGKLNQRQIDVIFEEIIPNQNIDIEAQSVGIISPYRLQTDELKKTIGTSNIEADTVHKYQGREKDVIILSTVANEIAKNDFVDNSNLINVAVSRAADKLIVVVADSSDEWKGTNICDLVRYIQYNNFEIIESQIYSVFDLLYSSYSEKLLALMKTNKHVSEYRSENLMNSVIEKVLCLPEFQSFNYVIHQPLKMLIKDPVKLNEDECKYAMNILTHTDFVIFNKVDKMPILVVEVDGYAYHANNSKQLERDNMKDEILRKYNIPIIRFRTNESGEEEKLRKKLAEVSLSP